jgi:23S rRNA (uridine2552-2'-O)-methyltransferase
VVDLGASPGGWSQVIQELVLLKRRPIESGTETTDTAKKQGLVIGIDLKPLSPLVENVTFLQLDITLPETTAKVKEVLKEAGREFADVVLSDMAPAATGSRRTDHLRLMDLGHTALTFAETILAAGGTFLVKVSRGGEENELKERMRHLFSQVVIVKPPASRLDSAETYFLGQNFKGGGKYPP